ncbi:DUF5320 domain-containing protein [Candidatus Aminicenantes bacterium AC-708-M15]|nr:DUF5320 domain-containing protein [SCandidatus Aminicenantes bacterium Aminicenantia_JdfR_composite]MCP2596470.1 DUF5320 domain-containing protein [Candidatus Aminicenantes bacterium AC-335-G13]MCP2598143.1 DUF5320 domain-containing protein [Candidatus Aminicenantes bacterium AC-335-L06]MCP2603866.1 DUF5320 domain-containing protein [Candidatus Aminicenantes bacterium AC-708-M15]MCP2605906.1 DUF5320 domain-containing protein [Candidatus Aminicenantes bacterium AC-335-O07]MCP2618064.1 DUF532
MPFGMGPAGWFMLPYFVQWMRYWGYGYPWYSFPYWFPYSPLNEEEEKAMLEQQKKILEDELTQINKRLTELKKTK